MTSVAKLTAVKLAMVLLPLAVTLAASSATADEQCSGTLCDLYYGKTSSFDDKPAAAQAPTPVTVPRQTIIGMFSGSGQPAATANAPANAATTTLGAPAKRPMVGVGGGGLAAWARGEAPEQCSGTFCDLYYGKTSSFEDKPEQPAAAAATAAAAAAPASTEVIADTASRPSEMAGFHTRPEPPRCAGTTRDPWSCFR